MHAASRAVVAALALAGIAGAGPVGAADLNGGSLKDDPGWAAAAAAAVAAPAGPCYFRTDVGHSWSMDPSSEYVGNPDSSMTAQRLSSGWFAEAGLGCGSGSRGLRGEVMLGLREDKDFRGDYTDFTGPPADARLSTSIRTYTAMFNGYYDLGNLNGFVPYVGAGIGVAVHDMRDVQSTAGPGIQFGDDKASFAWSLMAGVAYQLTDRAILDFGYRYIDLGSARSSHGGTVLASGPRLDVQDMTAHEFKVGLRYHFGTGASSAPVK
ncbi:MAG TPA: outer membrane beta-barrel protein [Hyphomicrobiaceae bacterium]|nr:outer membrane beta-barrel protein [Hyphomicrobiaceae bacterium]